MTEVAQVHAGTLHRVTRTLSFFASWTAARLRSIEPHTWLLSLDAGETLLGRESVDPFAYFLVDGELILEAEGEPQRRLAAGELDAGFPVGHLRPSRYAVCAHTPTKVLRIERSCLQSSRPRAGTARFRLDDASVGGSWRQHALVDDFHTGLDAGRVVLPSMPTIALKIRRVVADENFNLGDLATVIGADPAISAGLMRMANSALFRGDEPYDSVKGAIARLGVSRTQNLVTSIALKGVFVAEQPYIKTRLKNVWQHSVEIAALNAVLARLSSGLSADVALIVGLLHEIGAVPILRLAADYLDLEATPGIVDEILVNMVPEVSARILSEWQLSEDFSEAARRAREWFYDGGPEATYSDLTLVAHLHSLVRRREFEKLPRLDETPAFGKLALGKLSAKHSLAILEESRNRIQELRSLLA